ncbi:TonB-dependent receptor [uncultured Bacteroides sp.]|uniref:TonB-dependent receptor n=1 Tax=uncultured Bacteroides sp. TaxID=162156 RepID=UPI002AAACBD0|nr:TonB-dependent receptor [uncultured Bacteroides sp.]
MKKITIFFLSLLCAVTSALADSPELKASDANIYGHIIDKNTKEHLSFINVTLKGTTIGTVTDESGHYFLKNLPEGTFTVEASAVGYKSTAKKVVLKKGKTIELNMEIEEDMVALEGVVVSANRNATIRRLAPALVSVLDTKLFESTNAQCLAQGLSFQPGVRVENDCQNCGFNQVRINGLDGHYSQILMDSRPIFSALTGVYGLEQIPANMIERVEVIRGGGSALFGSSAIGGVVNIITKDPVRNSGELSHSITSIGSGGTFDNSTALNASLVTEDGKAGMYVYGQSRNRSGYDHNGDGYTELPQLRSKTVGMRSFLKTSTYSKLTLEYHGITEFRRGGDRLNRPAHEANIAEQVDHNINGGGISFDLFSPNNKSRLNVYSSFQHTDRKSYYGSKQDPNAYGTTKDLTSVSGAQFVYNFDKLLFMPSELTAGGEFNYDGLEDVSIGYDHYLSQKTRIWSGFLQNEWKNERWSLLVGARVDKHNLIDHAIISPRATLRFNPSKSINLRFNYSTGFRAPQAFDEDLHVAIVGGERQVIRLANNLKEEKSNSFSVSADMYHTFGNVQTNILVEGFYTDLMDVFALRSLNQVDEKGNTVKERYNGSGAKVMGINLEGKAVLTSWLQLQGGLTLQQSHYKKPEEWSEDANVKTEKKMFRTPNAYSYFTASLNPIKKLTASLSGTYTGSMLVQHMAGSGVDIDTAKRTRDFIDMNLKLAYNIPIDQVTIQLNGGVQNILEAYQKDFDKGVDRDSGYIYGPSAPRSYFLGAKISF